MGDQGLSVQTADIYTYSAVWYFSNSVSWQADKPTCMWKQSVDGGIVAFTALLEADWTWFSDLCGWQVTLFLISNLLSQVVQEYPYWSYCFADSVVEWCRMHDEVGVGWLCQYPGIVWEPMTVWENELTHNLSGNSRPQLSQLAELLGLIWAYRVELVCAS